MNTLSDLLVESSRLEPEETLSCPTLSTEISRTSLPGSAAIISGNRLQAECIQHEMQRLFAGIVVRIVIAQRSQGSLTVESADFLMVFCDNLQEDALGLLARHSSEGCRYKHVVAITSRHDPQTIDTLRKLAIGGVVDDSSEGLSELAHALRVVAAGRHYMSKSFLETGARQAELAAVFRTLSPRERLVLGVIGDGSDDASAAFKLGMKPASVQSMRRRLHRKLRVQRVPDLMRCVEALGLVVVLANGRVMRPGLSVTLAGIGRQRRPLKNRPCLCECRSCRPCVDCTQRVGAFPL
jgi:DNA-binding NarL/FixJ family response regulator